MIAQNLIDFDKQWSHMMAKRPEDFDSTSELEDFYVKTAEFPAGFMTQYQPSMIVAEPAHQQLATGFPIGKRFKSAPGDPRRGRQPRPPRTPRTAPTGVGGSTRSPTPAAPGASPRCSTSGRTGWRTHPTRRWCAYTPTVRDVDAVFDVKVVYQQDHVDVDLAAVPPTFLPRVGPLHLVDYEKVYADPARRRHLRGLRGIDRGGAVVVVRPDQYVAHVLPLTATSELAGTSSATSSSRSTPPT